MRMPYRYLGRTGKTFGHAGFLLLTAAVLWLGTNLPARAEDLPDPVLTVLRKAVFEVVVEKPKTDNLSYEKPLPYDLLPFRERNDKYQSIGTAFALDGGRFVSAGHVISLGKARIRDRIYLRDTEGRIIRMDQVLKYSTARDFIVFTVRDYQPAAVLKTHTAAKRNDKIFAVGNALGDGIIVRDGLYTSDTPEEEDGRWNWMRFSAAASPGNSGGPLLDREGRVVGIVLRKSRNENLNFALPMAEVLAAPKAKAVLHMKTIFRLDNTDRTLQDKMDESFDLPMDYQAFGRALQERINRFTTALAEKFNTTYRDDMFPVVAGSQAILYRSDIAAPFPRILSKQGDGTWDAVMPGERKQAEIGKNGKLTFGSMGNYLYLRLKLPDDVSVTQAQSDSRLFMDMILRGLYFNRNFGPERVRITSLGPALENEVHVDAYGRKWQVHRWMIEHSDEKVVAYTLPQPDGFAVMLSAADESISAMYEVDMKTLVDYAFVTYYGTLKQWKAFLSTPDLLPTAFGSIALEAEYGKSFHYQSKRVSLSYPDELMKVTENSDLHLKFSYFKENGKVVWDVSSIMAGEDKDTSTFVSLSREQRPPATLPDDDRQTWESLVKARMPYTGAAYFDKSRTVIAKAYRPTDAQGDLAQSSLLYSLAYSHDGTQEADLMASRLTHFSEGFRVKEH